ncbi:MAG: AbrB/MazE/SpoVT family DNA-binding domain-containing protein [Desulfurococcales archaeon]|nr:AbrB/MazE/SpoVT family DNA-binding domain-containing protein [Desulfurococcales archaeon]
MSKHGSSGSNGRGSQDAMLRKVQRLGASSLIVTLPRSWARRHNLKVGDYIYIYDEGDKLIMSPSSNGKEVSLSLDLRHTSNLKHLGKTCICSYIFGFDSIKLLTPRSVKLVNEKLNVVKSFLPEEVSIDSKVQAVDVRFTGDGDFFEALREYTRRTSAFIRKVHEILDEGCNRRKAVEDEYSEVRRLSYKILRLANKRVYIDSKEDRLGKILLNIANLTSLAATTIYTLALDAASLYDMLSSDEKERLKLLLELLEITMATIGSAVNPPSSKKAEDIYWKIKSVLDVRDNVRELVHEVSPAFLYMLGRVVDIAHIVEYITASIICYTIMSRAVQEE